MTGGGLAAERVLAAAAQRATTVREGEIKSEGRRNRGREDGVLAVNREEEEEEEEEEVEAELHSKKMQKMSFSFMHFKSFREKEQRNHGESVCCEVLAWCAPVVFSF